MAGARVFHRSFELANRNYYCPVDTSPNSWYSSSYLLANLWRATDMRAALAFLPTSPGNLAQRNSFHFRPFPSLSCTRAKRIPFLFSRLRTLCVFTRGGVQSVSVFRPSMLNSHLTSLESALTARVRVSA